MIIVDLLAVLLFNTVLTGQCFNFYKVVIYMQMKIWRFAKQGGIIRNCSFATLPNRPT